jgi:hypothetical protein
MTSKPLRFHPQAEEEYLTALAWYRERSLIAAINFESAFEHAVGRVRESPQRWPFYVAEFRKYTLRQFPFSIDPSNTPACAVREPRQRQRVSGFLF